MDFRTRILKSSTKPKRVQTSLSSLIMVLTLISSLLISCQPLETVISERSRQVPSEPYPFMGGDSSQGLVSLSKSVLDDDGVIQVYYGGRYGEDGLQYNPTGVARYAFALYREYLSNPEEAEKLNMFLAQADWFVENLVDQDGYGLWLYHFDQPTFGATNPWASAMAQGMGLSVLVDAHALTGEQKYLETADKAFQAFLVDMKDGGLRTQVGDGKFVYEEVADEDAPSSKILNGFIYALAGLYNYWEYIGEKKVQTAFNQGVEGLKMLIPEYDAEIISFYDLHFNRLSRRSVYNLIHVDQLIWLFEITEDPLFLKYALKFYSYEQFVPYVASVKGSTDPNDHGPEFLYLEGGYWSHNIFPTWIQLDLGAVQTVTSFTFYGYSKESSPKDYAICFSSTENGKEKCVVFRDNLLQIRTHAIPYLEAQYITMTIHEDNGNKNVALVGFGVETLEETTPMVAITNDHLSLYQNNAPSNMFDRNSTTFWEAEQEEDNIIWISLKQPAIDRKITFQGDHLQGMKVWISNDLVKWSRFDRDDTLEKGRYLKVEVEPGSIIREIQIEEIMD